VLKTNWLTMASILASIPLWGKLNGIITIAIIRHMHCTNISKLCYKSPKVVSLVSSGWCLSIKDYKHPVLSLIDKRHPKEKGSGS